MNLLKFLTLCGVSSRRKLIDAIKNGRVTVDGKVEKKPFFDVGDGSSCEIFYDGKKVYLEEKKYILLNKPKDCITTCSDEKGRKTVMDLVSGACKERVVPVGRLDRMTTGALLFTNDGELAQTLSHPSKGVSKEYRVEIDKPISRKNFEKIKKGFYISEEKGRRFFMKVDDCRFIDPKRLVVVLHSGKNRIVRRIFEALGFDIKKLDRISYAGLTTQGLSRGAWRFLTNTEIEKLKNSGK